MEAIESSDRSELWRLIHSVLRGDVTVAEFSQRFLAYYHDGPLDLSFSQREAVFFSDISERLDYTAAKVDGESRKYGYIDHREFAMWLRNHVRSLEIERAHDDPPV